MQSQSTHRVRNLLLVEDDARLAKLVRDYLENNGFSVTVVTDGAAAVAAVQRNRPDLIILDLGLPRLDGFSVCKQLRPAYANPIMILTARGSDIDHVLGLELGADDYVIKPVEPRLLLARINALLRRQQAPSVAHDDKVLRFGQLTVDPAAQSAMLHGQLIALSSAEFKLLQLLASHAGRVLSRETLYRQLYQRDYDGFDRTMDVRVSHLRKKLNDDPDNPQKIKTVWGQGYLFVPTAWS